MFNDHAFAQINRLRSELEKAFGSEFQTYGCAQEQPKVNLWHDAECVFLEAELPGVNLEDIEIVVLEGDQLLLKGKRNKPLVTDGHWIRNERNFGEFSRTFKLGCEVEVDGVKATMKNGLLHVCLPKAAAHKPKKIKIEPAG